MIHMIDPDLTTYSMDKVAIWGYSMTQYNLKLGLRKFGEHGAKAAVSELTQLPTHNEHVGRDGSVYPDKRGQI